MRCQDARILAGTAAYPYPGQSTNVAPSSPSISKQLRSCVRPGVLDTLARALRLPRALMSDDLPTLERPTTATSVRLAGRRSRPSADSTKRSCSGLLIG